MDQGYVDPSAVFIDSAVVKASVNKNKHRNDIMQVETKVYSLKNIKS
jgi:hypothetical protein